MHSLATFSVPLRRQPCPSLPPQVLGEDEASVRALADELGIYLKPSSYGMDVKPLLKEACRRAEGRRAGREGSMAPGACQPARPPARQHCAPNAAPSAPNPGHALN